MLPKLIFISILSSFIFSHSYSQCVEDQKRLLLQLNNDSIFNSSLSTKLVQWNQSDECCKWYGVECDAAGNVVSLQLDGEGISGGIGDSSSLFRLVYLQKLNLAHNDFGSTTFPKGIHKLTYLTHLNLSSAGFDGQLPAEISSLKRLVSLDLSNEFTTLSLEKLVKNLTGLRELYLDAAFVSAHESTKWSHIVSSYLPNITALSLRFCSLSGPLAKSFWQLRSLSILQLDANDLSTVVPGLFASFPKLTTLSLVGCSLNGSFPNMIFQMPTLKDLDLSFNLLSGSIPPFAQTGSLESIVLKGNNLSGSIPSSINNLRALSKIDMSHCRLTGSLPSTFANLTRLIHVDLSYNFFTGSLSSMLFEGLSSLSYLNMNENSLSGNIPHSLFGLPLVSRIHLSKNKFIGLVEEFHVVNVSNIVFLDLSNNRLEGLIPNSFFKLQRLDSLSLSGNLFNGTFQLDKIQSLANLTHFGLSRNNLSVDVGNGNSSTNGLPRLQGLGLASCNMRDFPNFIKNSDMRELDLSNNQIVGEIPSWIWGKQLQTLNLSFNLLTDMQKPYHIPDSLTILDLHSNKLRGELYLLIPPRITYNLQNLFLSSNSFNGSIPTSFCNASSLTVVDLSANRLSGSIPPCLLENIIELDLGRNNISGGIPDNFPLNCLLNYLDLNNNTLAGKIPKSLKSCESLQFMNVGNNMINDTFPCMLSPTLRVLVLHSNRFHGEVRCHRDWPELQVLDISSNNFRGGLKSVNFSSWTMMAQLSHDYTSYYTGGVILTMKGLQRELGDIWSDFGTVDFSSNNFEGEIPNAIGDLVSLHHLNFSHNALNGSIPKSLGQLSKLESLDLSQNHLTGPIPVELGGLTFLGFLNLSYNNLAGRIPNGPQLQTFTADSFQGNPGLCGSELNKSCSRSDHNNSSPPGRENEEEKREIEWKYVFAALGYVVGLGIIVWLLIFCRSLRVKYFDKIDDIVDYVSKAKNKKRNVQDN